MSFAKMRTKFMKKIESLITNLGMLDECEDGQNYDEFAKLMRKLEIFVHMAEETHLKEKLAYKRSLILCRSLLKQCRITNIEDQNVINIAETLIHPAVINHGDKE